jgi:hypothetical protein
MQPDRTDPPRLPRALSYQHPERDVLVRRAERTMVASPVPGLPADSGEAWRWTLSFPPAIGHSRPRGLAVQASARIAPDATCCMCAHVS